MPARPWTWLEQVHGTEVVEVSYPGQHAGVRADAAVTTTPGCALVVRTADCVPVALLSEQAVGIAHAGWRGLLGGVVDATVAALERIGAEGVRAILGPCISATSYEFGTDDLDTVEAAFGPAVRATTADGRPALDLTAAVTAALGSCGVEQIEVDGRCTAADPARWFSHRARGDTGRQGSFVWLDDRPARGTLR